MHIVQAIASFFTLLFGLLALFQLLYVVPVFLFGWRGDTPRSILAFLAIAIGGLSICLPFADPQLQTSYGVPVWLMMAIGAILCLLGWVFTPKRAS